MKNKKKSVMLGILLLVIVLGIIFVSIYFVKQEFYGGVPYISKELNSNTNSISGNVRNMNTEGDKKLCIEFPMCSDNFCGCLPECITFSPIILTQQEKDNLLGVRLSNFVRSNYYDYSGMYKDLELESSVSSGNYINHYYNFDKDLAGAFSPDYAFDKTRIYYPHDITIEDLENGFTLCGANKDKVERKRVSVSFIEAVVDIQVECLEDSDCESYNSTSFICVNSYCEIEVDEPEVEEEPEPEIEEETEEDEEPIITDPQPEEPKESLSPIIILLLSIGVGLLIVWIIYSLLRKKRKRK